MVSRRGARRAQCGTPIPIPVPVNCFFSTSLAPEWGKDGGRQTDPGPAAGCRWREKLAKGEKYIPSHPVSEPSLKQSPP